MEKGGGGVIERGRLRKQSNQSHIMKSCDHKAKCSMNKDEDNDKRD